MLSIFKRFGWAGGGTVATLPVAPAVVVGGAVVKVERAAQVQANYSRIDEASLQDASMEWASAITALHKAEANFNNADSEYLDTAIVALNIARMRADNARTVMSILLGTDKAEDISA